MKIRNFITSILALLVAFVGMRCTTDETTDFVPELSLSYTSYAVKQAGGEVTIPIVCNDKWTVTMAETVDWLTLSATEGEYDSDVTVTVAQNLTINSREVTLVVTSGELTGDFVITQEKGDEYVTIEPSALAVGKDAITETLSVSSNTTWTVTPDFGEDAAWFSVVAEDDATYEKNMVLEVEIDANLMADDRSAVIYFQTPNGEPVEYAVTQSATDATLVVTPETADEIGASGDTVTLSIACNSDWSLDAVTVDWFTAAVDGNTVTLTVLKNSTIEARDYTLKFNYGTDEVQDYKISQAAGAATISLSSEDASFSYEGGTSEKFTVTSNDDWSIEIDAADTWLSYTDNGDGTFTLTAVKNETDGLVGRTADVKVVCDSDSDTYKTIKVSQSTEDLDNLLNIDVTSVAFDSEGTLTSSSALVKLTSSYSWTVATVGNDDAWLSGIPADSSNDAEFTLEAAKNTSAKSRTATITITPDGEDDYAKTITVTQAGATATLVAADVDLGATNENEATLSITSNDSWTITNSDSASIFFSVTAATGENNKDVTLKATSSNPYAYARTFDLILQSDTDSSLTVTVTVTQAGSALVLKVAEGSSLEDFTYEGGTNPVSIDTNDNLTVSIPENDQEWLSAVYSNGTLSVKAEVNTGDERTSKVTLTSVTDTNEYIEVAVKQTLFDSDDVLSVINSTITFDMYGYAATSSSTIIAEESFKVTSIDFIGDGTDAADGAWFGGVAVNDAFGSGTQTLSFTATLNGRTNNTTYAERSAVITLTSDDTSETQTITVEQGVDTIPFSVVYEGVPYATNADITFPAEGGVFTIDVETTSLFAIKEWVSWITIESTTGDGTSFAGGTESFEITLDPNMETLTRGGISGGGLFSNGRLYLNANTSGDETNYKIGELYIVQEAHDPLLDVTKGLDVLSSSEGSSTLSVESNVAWSAEITAGSDWLTFVETTSATTASGNPEQTYDVTNANSGAVLGSPTHSPYAIENISFSYTENKDDQNSRKATVKFTAEGCSPVEVVVEQYAAIPSIFKSVSAETIEFDRYGYSATPSVTIDATGAWSIKSIDGIALAYNGSTAETFYWLSSTVIDSTTGQLASSGTSFSSGSTNLEFLAYVNRDSSTLSGTSATARAATMVIVADDNAADTQTITINQSGTSPEFDLIFDGDEDSFVTNGVRYIDADGGDYKFTVTTDTYWRYDEWIANMTVNGTSSDKYNFTGSHEVTLTFVANKTSAAVSGSSWVMGGSTTTGANIYLYTIKYEQAAAAENITPTSDDTALYSDSTGGTISVSSNVEWTASVTAGDSWLELNGTKSGGSGTTFTETDVTFTVSGTPDAQRTGTITFTNSGGTVTNTINIVQETATTPIPDSLTASVNQNLESAANSTATLTIEANCSWSLPADLSGAFFTASPTEGTGTGNETVTLTAKADNDGADAYTYDLVITYGASNETKTVKITQDASVADPVVITISAEPATATDFAADSTTGQTFTITTNDTAGLTASVTGTNDSAFTASYDAGTLTVTPTSTNALTDTALEATVTLTSKTDTEVSLSIPVKQLAAVAGVTPSSVFTLEETEVTLDRYGYIADADNSVTISATADWEIEKIEYSSNESTYDVATGWLTITGGTVGDSVDANGSKTLSFAAPVYGANLGAPVYENYDDRYATITFKSGTETKTLKVVQSGKYILFPLTVDNASYTLGTEMVASVDGQVYDITFGAETLYVIKEWTPMTVSVDGVLNSSTFTYLKGAQDNVKFTIPANTSGVATGTKVVYFFGGAAQSDEEGLKFGEFKYSQPAAAAVFASANPASNMSAFAGSGSISVKSNLAWTAEVTATSDDSGWLTLDLTDDEKETSETVKYGNTTNVYTESETLSFTFAKNAVAETRTATITLKADGCNDITITVTQDAAALGADATYTISQLKRKTLSLEITNTEFTQQETLTASDFSVAYTNSGSTDNTGTINVTSAVVESDLKTVTLTLEANTYNTDVLTLSYSGSDITMDNSGALKAFTASSVTTSPSVFVDCNFETASASTDWFVYDKTNSAVFNDVNMSYDNPLTTGINSSSKVLYVNADDKIQYSVVSPEFTTTAFEATIYLTLNYYILSETALVADTGFSGLLNNGDVYTYKNTNFRWLEFNNWLGVSDSSKGEWKNLSLTCSDQGANFETIVDDMRFVFYGNGLKNSMYFDDIKLYTNDTRPDLN